MDQNKIQKLVILCHQIARDGMVPGVGTLRGKAPMKVSVTEAIEAMKLYQQSTKIPDVNNAQKQSRTQLYEQRIEQLEQRIASLEDAVSALMQRLN